MLNHPGDRGHPDATYGLHSYWDVQTVSRAMVLFHKDIQAARKGNGRSSTLKDIVWHLATVEPTGWTAPTGDIEKWPLQWADEILPTAREAFDRLEFTQISLDKKTRVARGFATPIAKENVAPYDEWAGQVVHDMLHIAGWRLAAILEKALE